MQNNAGEYIVTLRSGKYAVFANSQTWGSLETGGNFAIILLAPDLGQRARAAVTIWGMTGGSLLILDSNLD